MYVLEAFGHAPTLYNSNSTRFAKYINLNYTTSGELFSANINAFMLEKSRVTLDTPSDRNFLIFYYLLSGLDKNTLEALKLKDIQKHRITRLPEGLSSYQSRQWNEKFHDLKHSLINIGFRDDDLQCLYRLLAIIILLCDIEFELMKDNNNQNQQKSRRNITNEILYIKNHEILYKGMLFKPRTTQL